MLTRSRVLRCVAGCGLAAATLLLAGCGEEDATSVKITLNPGGGGEVLASSLSIPAQPGPVESGSSGAAWSARAVVNVAKGTFADINALKIADLSFEVVGTSQEMLVVTLPRGTSARWPVTLSIPDVGTRAQATGALDPGAKQRASRFGTTVKLEVTLPGNVVATGVNGKTAAIQATFDERTATLLVPVDEAFKSGEPLRWHVSWEK